MFFNYFKRAAGAFLISAVAAGSAGAVVLDFADEGDQAERPEFGLVAVSDGVNRDATNVWVAGFSFDSSVKSYDSGLTASDLAANPELGYFDGFSGGKPAGLGVCSGNLVGKNNEFCDPSSDDNVGLAGNVTGSSIFEVVYVGISPGAELSNFEFRGANHDVLTAGILRYSIDGSTWLTYDFSSPMNITLGFGGLYLGYAGTQFYLSTVETSRTDNPPPPVPLPAGALLLLSGAGGLGLLRLRKKKS